MNDELKNAWQSQTSAPRPPLDAGLVLNEVRRKEQQFAAMIFFRDLREVGVALVMVPVWIVMGIALTLPWSWYLTIPGLLWIAGFLLVDRKHQAPKRSAPGDSLRDSVGNSLAQVEHQIWLLRNVVWWYLLPLFIPMTLFVAQVSLGSRSSRLETVAGFVMLDGTFALVFWFVYWLNQRAVRKDLEPRRKELQTLLGTLDESGE